MGLQFGGASELQYPEDELQYPNDDEFSLLQDCKEMLKPGELATLRSTSEVAWTPTPIPSQQASCTSIGLSAADDADAFSYRQVWTKEDRGDLAKLGKMISSFLNVSRFAVEEKLFELHVINSLMDDAGPKPGSIQVLTQVMESVMIRHRQVLQSVLSSMTMTGSNRIVDIEKEVVLPMLYQETVLLDLDPLGVKTYNVLQAIIAINAVTSERVGAVSI
jgi:hypothetical protein